MIGSLIKGSLRMPRDNDSPFLLDKHRRGLQNLDRMARYRDGDTVDLAIVGAGAGGLTLAQRLARRGWRIVVLEKGPLWDPDRDWVSDEKGAGPLCWTTDCTVAPISSSTAIAISSSYLQCASRYSSTHACAYDVPRTDDPRGPSP